MMNTNIKDALDYLNEHQIRATYTAVQSYLGHGVISKLNWKKTLGPHRPYASWVVNKKTGMPSDYDAKNLHPDLLANDEIIAKGKQLQVAVEEYLEKAKDGPDGAEPTPDNGPEVEVADCHGNNCAVICPACTTPYVVSGFLDKGVRKCPHCGESKAVFKEAKKKWEDAHQDDLVESEQEATRLMFKKEWLGYDVWVTFTEDGATYRYPHDQLLQTFISRMGIIGNTKLWADKGVYHFPRLSLEQKKLLSRYRIELEADEPEQMVMVLQEDAPTDRTWDFRDDIDQNYHGDIPANQSITTLTLNWKPDKNSTAKLVGKYRIDLDLLLSAGFAKETKKGIFLRFQRTDNAIEIAVDRDSPALVVGSKPE